jgi:hypothetical protein
MAPCAYDGRPGFLGWMNRTGLEIRQAFTPRYTAQRHYVPNIVAQQIPVTRQVAQHSTRQVTYNVTRMEPRVTTRQVAVHKVRMVSREITVQRPVTVMRTVPIGSTIAYVPFGSGGATATAMGPTPDPISARSQPLSRSANAGDNPSGAFQRNEKKKVFTEDTDANRSSYRTPARDEATERVPQANADEDGKPWVKVPTAARVGRWAPRKSVIRAAETGSTSVTVADSSR